MVWLSILGGVCNRISARERGNMSRTTDRAGRNKGQWIVIGFMAFAIIVISICTVIFRSYVRGFHKVTDRKEVNIANGTVPADSLVIGSIDCPILLVEANEIPEATKQAFEESKFEKVNVFGGENSVNESIVKELIK